MKCLNINYAEGVYDKVKLILPEWLKMANANIFMSFGIETNEKIYDSKFGKVL